HARPGSRVVVDVDVADAPGVLQSLSELHETSARAAERRIELDRDDPLPAGECGGEPGLLQLLAERDHELTLGELERRPRLPVCLDGGVDGGDLCRGRPTAASDQRCAELTRVRGEL